MQKEWISTNFYYTHRTKHWRLTKVLYMELEMNYCRVVNTKFPSSSASLCTTCCGLRPYTILVCIININIGSLYVFAHICFSLTAADGETFRHKIIAVFFAHRPTRFYISFTKKLPKWRHKMKWVMRWVWAFHSDAAAFGPAECVRKKVFGNKRNSL